MKAEDRAASELQKLAIGVLSADGAQEVRACDETFCALFRCEPKDVIGRAVDELISPRDRRAAMTFASRMSRFDGSMVDLLATLRIRGRDQLARLRIVQQDDGFDVFVEPALDESDPLFRLSVLEQRWKGMLRSSDDGIVILDSDGRILEHNTSFFTLMQFRDTHGVSLSEDAVASRSLLDLAGDMFPGLADYLRSPDGDFVVRSVGSRRLEMKASAIVLAGGERTGTFLLVRDVAQQLQIEARDEVIRRDLEHARAFQQAILSAPPAVPLHDISVTYRPLEDVGGDIYDLALIGPHQLRVFIADATGHGVPAALVTMLVKGAYESVKHVEDAPAELLAALNDRVATTSAGPEAIFTATIVDVDLAARTIRWSCGGHPPALLARGDGAVEELETGGAIVGIVPGLTFPSWTRQLDPDDGLYLVTDGIAEARRNGGEFFGDERLRKAVAEANGTSSNAGEAIVARLNAWLRPSRPDDDMTVIAVRPVRT